MLKQSVTLIIFIYTFGLFYTPQISLAKKPTVIDNNSFNNSVKKPIDYADDLVTQPIRLVINLSRHQVTLYQGTTRIKSYPIAVGRKGWETPRGNFQVLDMLENPTWIHPFTGKAIPGGSRENPLGHYWVGFWTNGKNWIGFHGTPNPESVGKAASHGCIRMYNKDIKELFQQVRLGTPVIVLR
ncbi:MAG: L,D-transpeptidase [Spirirestis rafaelensis WJT71-NPBG6]|nr:L,D-transpeptidase [Spirirestis rafaelensis WJT71-NPBG6]